MDTYRYSCIGKRFSKEDRNEIEILDLLKDGGETTRLCEIVSFWIRLLKSFQKQLQNPKQSKTVV